MSRRSFDFNDVLFRRDRINGDTISGAMSELESAFVRYRMAYERLRLAMQLHIDADFEVMMAKCKTISELNCKGEVDDLVSCAEDDLLRKECEHKIAHKHVRARASELMELIDEIERVGVGDG